MSNTTKAYPIFVKHPYHDQFAKIVSHTTFFSVRFENAVMIGVKTDANEYLIETISDWDQSTSAEFEEAYHKAMNIIETQKQAV